MIIVTDTASDILESEAKSMDIKLITILSIFEDETIDKNTEESFARFYKKLDKNEALPASSQPSPDKYLTVFEQAKEAGEEVLVITISSKLSGTYNCAVLAQNMAEYDKIYIVDSLQASLSQRLLVNYAVRLRDKGMNAVQIAEQLLAIRSRIFLTGVPADMRYLKKGGRVSPVIANIGDIIGIKPVLWLKDGVIECKMKVRGCKAAKAGMQSFLTDMELSDELPVLFGHSNNETKGNTFMEETMSKFNLSGCSLHNVGPAIGTHIGPDALLMAFVTK